MSHYSDEIIQLLTTSVFKKLLNSDTIQIEQLNSATSILIKAGIPFDIEFSPGTRRLASVALLTVHITPTTRIEFTITFEAGSGGFGDL